MTEYTGSRSTIPLILNLGPRYRCEVNHTPANSFPGKNPGTYLTGGWLGPRASPDVSRKGKYLLPLPGFETQIIQPF